MYVIHTIEEFKPLKNICRTPHGFTLIDGATHGELESAALTARMAYNYQGFETTPETGVRVAIVKPIVLAPSAPSVLAPALAPTPIPPPIPQQAIEYQTAAQIRDRIQNWVGSIQFRVRLERDKNGRAPLLSSLKVGYFVPGEPLVYTLDFALPNLLSSPVQLNRVVRPNATGTAVPFPAGLQPDRVKSVFVHAPEREPIPGNINANAVVIPQPVPLQPVRLVYDYAPPVYHATGLFQVQEIPCIVLRALEGLNYRECSAEDSIRLSASKLRLWSSTYTYDQLIEASAIAETISEAQAIAQNLMQLIRMNGYLYLPGFGFGVPLQMRGGIRQNFTSQQGGKGEDQSSIRRGNLQSVTIRFALINMLEGESIQDVNLFKTPEIEIN